jgi:DNA-binding transcriptional MocR family regulator
MAALASQWIADGTLAAITGAIRAEAQARQAIATEALAGLDFAADPSGYHAWLKLPAPWRRQDMVMDLRQSGLSIIGSEIFSVTGEGPEAVRLALGVAPDRATLTRALRLVATTLRRLPHRAATFV